MHHPCLSDFIIPHAFNEIHGAKISGLTNHIDGTLFSSSYDGTTRRWRFHNTKNNWRCDSIFCNISKLEPVRSLCIANNILCTASTRGCIQLWDISKDYFVNAFRYSDNTCITAIKAFENILISGDENGRVYCWNLDALCFKENTKKFDCKLPKYDQSSRIVSIEKFAHNFVVGNVEGDLQFLSIKVPETGVSTPTLISKQSSIIKPLRNFVVCDGKILLSGNQLALFQATTTGDLKMLHSWDSKVDSLHVLDSSGFLLGMNHSISRLDTRTNTIVKLFDHSFSQTGNLSLLNSNEVAICGNDAGSNIEIWDLRKGKLLYQMNYIVETSKFQKRRKNEELDRYYTSNKPIQSVHCYEDEDIILMLQYPSCSLSDIQRWENGINTQVLKGSIIEDRFELFNMSTTAFNVPQRDAKTMEIVREKDRTLQQGVIHQIESTEERNLKLFEKHEYKEIKFNISVNDLFDMFDPLECKPLNGLSCCLIYSLQNSNSFASVVDIKLGKQIASLLPFPILDSTRPIITCHHFSNREELWLGFNCGNIVCFNIKKKKYVHLLPEKGPNPVKSIFHGEFVVAQADCTGAIRIYQSSSSKPYQLTQRINTNDEIVDICVLEERNFVIWATKSGYLHIRNWKISSVQSLKISHRYIRSLAIKKQENQSLELHATNCEYQITAIDSLGMSYNLEPNALFVKPIFPQPRFTAVQIGINSAGLRCQIPHQMNKMFKDYSIVQQRLILYAIASFKIDQTKLNSMFKIHHETAKAATIAKRKLRQPNRTGIGIVFVNDFAPKCFNEIKEDSTFWFAKDHFAIVFSPHTLLEENNLKKLFKGLYQMLQTTSMLF